MYDLKCQTIKHQTSSAFSRAMTVGGIFLLVFSQQLVISVPVSIILLSWEKRKGLLCLLFLLLPLVCLPFLCVNNRPF